MELGTEVVAQLVGRRGQWGEGGAEENGEAHAAERFFEGSVGDAVQARLFLRRELAEPLPQVKYTEEAARRSWWAR